MLNITKCTPIGEIHFKKTLDVGFKPIPFKPLALIKEKWSPFGKFGIKQSLVKRDLDSIQGVEKVTPMPMGIETRLPAEVYEVEQPGFIPERVPLSKEIVPIQAPPLSPVVLVTPPPNPQKIEEVEPIKNGLFTDIGRVEMINQFLQSSELIPPNMPFLPEENVLPPISNSIIPDKPKDPPPAQESSNPFVRGSRFALYMGNILLDILTKFLSRTAAGPEQLMQI